MIYDNNSNTIAIQNIVASMFASSTFMKDLKIGKLDMRESLNYFWSRL